MKKIILVIAVVLLAFLILFIFTFDNTTKKVVQKDNVKIVFYIVSKNDRKIFVKGIITNKSDFDVDFLTSGYSDSDLRFEIMEDVITVRGNSEETFEFAVELSKNVKSKKPADYLNSKRICFDCTASAANQNEVITKIPVRWVNNK